MNTGNIKVHFSEDVIDWVVSLGFSAKYGARPLQQVVEQQVAAALGQALLADQPAKRDTLAAAVADNGLVVTWQ